MIQKLLEKQVDFDYKDEKRLTPLILACYNNQLEAAKALLILVRINGTDMGGGGE